MDGAKEPTWAIERMRYVKIREFKGKLYVDIREFYEKDGEEMPGKKGFIFCHLFCNAYIDNSNFEGISLTAAQFQKLKAIIPEVDAELKKM